MLKVTCNIVVVLLLGEIILAQNNVRPNGAANSNSQQEEPSFVEEIVVESSLNIRPKPPVSTVKRTQRDVNNALNPLEQILFAPLNRAKRQFGFGQNFGGSQSTANANANSVNFRPNGFNSADALASAQGFNSFAPSGSFGANSANTLTNSINAGPYGSQAAFGASGSQVYHLPNGQTLNLAFSDTFGQAQNAGPASGQSSSVSLS